MNILQVPGLVLEKEKTTGLVSPRAPSTLDADPRQSLSARTRPDVILRPFTATITSITSIWTEREREGENKHDVTRRSGS